MLRWWRRKLRMLRYYSASREETVWTRLGDAAFLAALVLAFPATWLMNGRMQREAPPLVLVGLIERGSNGELSANVMNERESLQLPINPMAEYWGSFRLTIAESERGWPFITSMSRKPVDLAVRRAGEPRIQATLDPKEAEQVSAAVRAGLERRQDADLFQHTLAHWQHDDERHTHHVLAWIAGSITWAFTLFVGFSVLLLVARLTSIFLFNNRAARRRMLEAEGKCPRCTYDLRGLEFSDRCPECGELMW